MKSKIEIEKIEDINVWNEFLNRFENRYFQQSWEWGEFYKSQNRRIERVGIYFDKVLVGVSLLIEEDSRFGKLVYSPRGPIMDWSNVSLRGPVMEQLVEHVKASFNPIFLRVDPAAVDSEGMIEKECLRIGFHNSVGFWQVERAWVLEIAGRSDEDLLKGMRKNTRYYINKAVREGIEIIRSEDIKDVEQLALMLEDLSSKKGFSPMPKEYLINQFKMLGGKNGFLRLYKAVKDGKTLATAIIAFYGHEASYLHGASKDLGNTQAPYLLQWQAIRDARESGLSRYNFWGVVKDENYHPNHPGFGYSNFKRGFGGFVEQYIHTKDYIYKPIQYWLFKTQERYRQWRFKGN